MEQRGKAAQGGNYAFFSHRECEYFPCHQTDDLENFNCLFCYCPLYALGENCGGNCLYTPAGVKDCSHCLVPHCRNSQQIIAARFAELAKLAAKK